MIFLKKDKDHALDEAVSHFNPVLTLRGGRNVNAGEGKSSFLNCSVKLITSMFTLSGIVTFLAIFFRRGHTVSID